MHFEEMRGAYSALFTPYTKDNRINTEMIGRLVEHQLAGGLRGFFVGGTTGESMLLTLDERKLVLETVVAANRGRGKVIAHVGAVRTEDSVDLARHAADCGADWVASVPPVYFAQTFEGTLYHYSQIAGASDLPFMVYAFRTTVDPERDARLFEIKNLKGMKFTNSNYYSIQQLRRRLDKPALFLSGMDELLVCALSMGVFHGGIGTTYNMLPRHFAEICRLVLECGDVAAARPLQHEANALIALALKYGNMSYSKAIMRFMGLDCGYCRAPFPPVSEEQYAAFADELRAQGILQEGQI
ncbi:MAG: dihydrodipicolinate synthase family protein [Kiritimatiellae bacterium]|nr:dihydrodipicolinate synthase family protein [Kiritimatiellia bacterium]MDD4622039.1 dihydrodipicolinate synthase family protein [Kiritimatiellia bacterium]